MISEPRREKTPTLSAGTVGAEIQNEMSRIEEDLMRAVAAVRGSQDVWQAIGHMAEVERRAREIKERLAKISSDALNSVLQSPQIKR